MRLRLRNHFLLREVCPRFELADLTLVGNLSPGQLSQCILVFGLQLLSQIGCERIVLTRCVRPAKLTELVRLLA